MMKRNSLVTGLVLSLAGLLTLAATPVRAQVDQKELLRRSDIVLVGTVTQLGASSFAGVPEGPNSLVVRVDGILEKPEAVTLAQGDEVTVHVQDPAAFQEGVQATFYAQGWILGQGVAVREIGHILTNDSQPAMFTQQRDTLGSMRQEIQDDELRRRIEQADVVVAGRVVSVQQPTIQAAGGPPPPISEHNPDWREAIVEVETAIKGAQAGERVVIRFPSSMDIAWYDAPKFQEGQEGTFILQRDSVTGTPIAMMEGGQVAAYTALDSLAVLPRSEARRVQELAEGSGG